MWPWSASQQRTLPCPGQLACCGPSVRRWRRPCRGVFRVECSPSLQYTCFMPTLVWSSDPPGWTESTLWPPAWQWWGQGPGCSQGRSEGLGVFTGLLGLPSQGSMACGAQRAPGQCLSLEAGSPWSGCGQDWPLRPCWRLSRLPRAGAAGGLGALRGGCAIQAASSWRGLLPMCACGSPPTPVRPH